MKTGTMKKTLVVCVLFLWSFAPSAFAGDLEPSAPPAPTMKTLDQVEPRIPIPGSTTAVSTFTISQSGSYYLTGDRLCLGRGIEVDVDNVTIDLMGYQLIGPIGGSNDGVYLYERSNVEVRNGTITKFGRYAVYENVTTGKNHRVINIRAVSNGTGGISLNGIGHLVKDCTAADNGDSSGDTVRGISVGDYSTVTGCTAVNNGNSCRGLHVYGIHAYIGCSITNNMVYNNGKSASGNNVYGIFAYTGSTVAGNTSNSNGHLANNQSVHGIYANSGSSVIGNTVYNNGFQATSTNNISGIFTGNGSTVLNNTAYLNGDQAPSATVYGIYLGGYNAVTGNTCYDNNGTQLFNTGTCSYGVNVPQIP